MLYLWPVSIVDWYSGTYNCDHSVRIIPQPRPTGFMADVFIDVLRATNMVSILALIIIE